MALTLHNGYLRSKQMRSVGEVTSGESQISNKAGDTGSACAETGEGEVFGYNPMGLPQEQRKLLGRRFNTELA